MRHVAKWLFIVMVFGSTAVACAPRREVVVVREPRPARPCAGGVWIEGHHGRHGQWHHGHWRCPGVVEVIEVE